MVDQLNDNSSRGGRWVCPNDRHLALRAKLRTGWSVKTGSLNCTDYPYALPYNSPAESHPALTEEERRTIIEVIQRAEALDLSEQERVGRLVDRLENMKRNVTVVTSTRSTDRSCSSRCAGAGRCTCSCALCGERFAVLGAGPSLCKDCRKNICQKCGIEATPFPGPNLGPNPTILSATATSPQANAIAQGFQIKSSGNTTRLFLCRICSETREMWKKSGAWFFKGLPKYVLPEKRVQDRGRSGAGSRPFTWAVVGNLRPLETVEQDSSSDEDANRRLAVTRSFSATVNDSSVKEILATTTTRTNEQKHRSSAGSIIYRRQSSAPILDGDLNNVNSNTYYCGQSIAGDIGHSQIFPSASSSAMPSRNQTRSSICTFQTIDDHTQGPQVYPIRRGSTGSSSHSFLLQDRNQDQDRDKDWDQENLATGSDCTSNSHNLCDQKKLIPIGQAESMVAGQGYGTLEISLRYDPTVQCLQCRVERARGLRPMDIHGLADPFCKLNILPNTASMLSRRLRTKTVHKTRDPEFNETVTFYGTTETDMRSGSTLHIRILQDDPAGRDFLGEARLPLHDLQPCQTTHYNVFLESEYQVDQEEEIWGEGLNPRGRILVTLSYNTRRRALLVTVFRAANLLPMDSNGFSDPFVKLCLIKNPIDNLQHRRVAGYTTGHKKEKKQTRRTTCSTGVKWKTLNPEWNEEFAFETRLTDLTSLTLSLSVWDKDFGKSNDYLGGLTLGCCSKGERLRQWIDAIKFPDHRHQAWHNLTEEPVPTE